MNKNNIRDYDYEPDISADELARQNGYSDYSDYCDEYYEGHTGGELGEPAVWEPDLDDFESDDDCDYKTEDYCEGFADGYSEGYEDGWDDCTEYFESDDCDW